MKTLSLPMMFVLLCVAAVVVKGQDAPPAGSVLYRDKRILFDTVHWNPSLREGRYRAVADLLVRDGYDVVAGAVVPERTDLSRYRVLFIVTPYITDPLRGRTSAGVSVFSDADCDALEAWVRAGGSLLLVVGHEPSGAATGNLVRRFGVDVRNGTTNDTVPINNWVEGNAGCRGCLKFSIDNELLRPHPITMGRDSTERVRAVASAVGTSLGVASGSHKLLSLSAAAYDVVASGDTVSAGGRAQAVAMPFGTGRVVIIGDGSILSGIPYGVENPQFRRWWPRDPDNGQFTLNVVRWLAGVLPENPQSKIDAYGSQPNGAMHLTALLSETTGALRAPVTIMMMRRR